MNRTEPVSHDQHDDPSGDLVGLTHHQIHFTRPFIIRGSIIDPSVVWPPYGPPSIDEDEEDTLP